MRPTLCPRGITSVNSKSVYKHLFFFDTCNNTFNNVLNKQYIISMMLHDDKLMLQGSDVWTTTDLYNYDTIVKNRLIRCSCHSKDILILHCGELILSVSVNPLGPMPISKHHILIDNKSDDDSDTKVVDNCSIESMFIQSTWFNQL